MVPKIRAWTNAVNWMILIVVTAGAATGVAVPLFPPNAAIWFALWAAAALVVRVTRLSDATYAGLFQIMGRVVMLVRERRVRGFDTWVAAHEEFTPPKLRGVKHRYD